MRGILARRDAKALYEMVKEERRVTSASAIQAHARGMQCRLETKRQSKAANTIAAVVQGRKARAQVLQARQTGENRKAETASLTLQSQARILLARRKADSLRAQRVIRLQVAAATKLQAHARVAPARRHLLQSRTAATTIATAERARNAVQWKHRRMQAVIRLQAIARGQMGRRAACNHAYTLHAARNSLAIYAMKFRIELAQREAERSALQEAHAMRKAAMALQAQMRSILARRIATLAARAQERRELQACGNDHSKLLPQKQVSSGFRAETFSCNCNHFCITHSSCSQGSSASIERRHSVTGAFARSRRPICRTSSVRSQTHHDRTGKTCGNADAKECAKTSGDAFAQCVS